jgi:ribosomal protein S18 acetylase RimI-like enzyme
LRILVKRSEPAPAQPPARRFGILAIATDPEVRGAGAGRALMAEAEDRARRLGHERAVLTVHPRNTRAIEFYERLGWTRRISPGTPWAGAMDKQL